MITDEQLEQAIAKVGLITPDVLKASKEVAANKQHPLADILLEKGLIKISELGQLIARFYNVKFVDLRKESIKDQVLKILPELVAAKQQAIVFRQDEEGLKVALTDPTNYKLLNILQKKTGERVVPYFTLPQLISESLSLYRNSIRDEFEDIIKVNVAKAEKSKPEDVPVIKIVDNLIAYGFHNDASDIHIEPMKDHVVVRFRIDGILHDVLTLPKAVHDLIVARIKILSRLRTDEHRSAQDGKISSEIQAIPVEIRVSIIPVTQGEKVVMRLLSSRRGVYTLPDLGLAGRDLKIVEQAITKPHGMILATGPTGSGKTTTLYTLIQLINSRTINISTIEDPVEYDIEGVNQIQVDPKTNLTFAAGLRSLLRQDPDVIMVGEIRDEETAGIAVNSAMTGHLVLSSLHTNDAATALPRLIDMKVEPFLIASTVDVIIAQRLVRKICMQCIASYTLSESQRKDLSQYPSLTKFLPNETDNEFRVYKGNGCSNCNHTGFKGRIGLYEILRIDDNIRDLIMKRTNADEIERAATSVGMTTMLQDGLEKIKSGKTTIEEVLRATAE